MIDMAELVIPTLTIMGPLVVGAFKGYFAIKLMRVLADIVSPTVAALGVMFFLNLLLIHTQVVTESDLTNIWYPAGLGAITVFSGFGFYLAVGLGGRLAERNHAGLQSDMENGLVLAKSVIVPSLEDILRQSEERTKGIMTEKTTAL